MRERSEKGGHFVYGQSSSQPLIMITRNAS